MKVLLTYPEYPNTFFSFKHSLHFVSRKAALPPLGLITISALLPQTWQKKLVDLNTSPLLKDDLQWADYVFISAMHIQQDSVSKIIRECMKVGVKMVAGGPLFMHEYHNYPQIDHFILNEAEITLPLFLKDLERGKLPQRIYKTNQFADISDSPVPDFHLLERKAYASLNLQLSRGCPYSCDFCEIPSLLGQKVRLKKVDQVIKELDALYQIKWRGSVSIVDDNFIGDKKEIKSNILPAMISWMRKHRYPFIFNIQTSINLADDQELVSLMIEAGINSTFVGIETPSENSLQDCKKAPNRNRDMLQDVKNIQKSGMLVSGGFIVGFDSDSPDVFQQQIDFIQQSGIVWAMVGLLNAPKGTRLYKRLEAENRLTTEVTGNNTDFSMNFVPSMNAGELLKGYHSIVQNIYSPEPYYKRIRQCLLNIGKINRKLVRIDRYYILAFFKSINIIGIKNRGQIEYWRFLCWTLVTRPGLFPYAIMFSICGYHFRRVYGLENI